MMRNVRRLLGTLGVGAVLVAAWGCGAARANAAGVWVQVSPGTIEAGNLVTVRADCGDASNAATVTSKAFKPLTLQPMDSQLQGQAFVPATIKPGTFGVDLRCKTGSTATTTLTVLGGGAGPTTRPTVGPHTGGGFLANGSATEQGDTIRAWLVGGLSAFVAAGAVGIVGLRRSARRRRTPARVR